MPYYVRRHTSYHATGRKRVSDNRSCSNNDIVSELDARQDDTIGGEPAPFANVNWIAPDMLTEIPDFVICGYDLYPRRDDRVIVDHYAVDRLYVAPPVDRETKPDPTPEPESLSTNNS